MSTACVDPADFQTDANGRLQLNPDNFLQSAAQTFSHVLDGAQGVFEVINEMTPLVVTVAGKYEVTADMHGLAGINRADPGEILSAAALGAVGLNGAVIGGTQTMLARTNQGNPVTTEAAMTTEGTGSVTRILDLNVGDVLTIMGARVSDIGTDTRINSSNQGFTRLLAKRIGPQ